MAINGPSCTGRKFPLLAKAARNGAPGSIENQSRAGLEGRPYTQGQASEGARATSLSERGRANLFEFAQGSTNGCSSTVVKPRHQNIALFRAYGTRPAIEERKPSVAAFARRQRAPNSAEKLPGTLQNFSTHVNRTHRATIRHSRCSNIRERKTAPRWEYLWNRPSNQTCVVYAKQFGRNKTAPVCRRFSMNCCKYSRSVSWEYYCSKLFGYATSGVAALCLCTDAACPLRLRSGKTLCGFKG